MPTIEEILETGYVVVLHGTYKEQTLQVRHVSTSGDFLDCYDYKNERAIGEILRSDVRLATDDEIRVFTMQS